MALVVHDGLTVLDVTGPAEVLHEARQRGHAYAVTLVPAHGGPVTATSGISLGGTVTADDAGSVDTLIVPGSPGLAGPVFDDDLLALVRVLAARTERVASVCTGAFLLAELGLLDGRAATTHWRHAHALARRYPRVRVQPDVIHVRDGHCITSAGITADIDMALALVEEDHGADAARDIARELVMFVQRPGGQSQYSTALSAVAPLSSLLRALACTDGCRARPSRGRSQRPGHGPNSRRQHPAPHAVVRHELQTTPARWVERVRLDRAQQLLLAGHSVTTAAQHSGFGHDESLRRTFARLLDTTPTDYRRRFATTRS